jgi:hypothetical protein
MNRAILAIAGLAGLSALAACVPDNSQVSASPPTVSYRVSGTDISQANVSAAQYCQNYGTAAQYQGLQAMSAGNVAVYSCNGAPVATSGSSAPPPYSPQPYGSPPPYSAPRDAGPSYAPPPGGTVTCADRFHQSLPGGTDYYGPPVPGCPPLQ